MSNIDSENRHHEEETSGSRSFAEHIGRNRFRDRLGSISFKTHGLRLLAAMGIAYFVILPKFGLRSEISLPKFIIEPGPIPIVRTLSEKEERAIEEVSPRYSTGLSRTEMWSQPGAEVLPTPMPISPEEKKYRVISDQRFLIYIRKPNTEVHAEPQRDSEVIDEIVGPHTYEANQIIAEESQEGIKAFCYVASYHRTDSAAGSGYVDCGDGIYVRGDKSNVMFAEIGGPFRNSFFE